MELKLLQKENISQIAALEKHLWREGLKEREQKLIWKYSNIPDDKYLGAVAIENDEVIGFRGLVSSKWIEANQSFKVVHYTDAVVSPDHRGKGVLSKLNNFLQEEYKNSFDFIMVFFPNKISGHIYNSQGVSPFFKVNFFYRKFLINIKKPPIKYVVISNNKENEVYSLIQSYYERITQKIHLEYSTEYIHWKLSEPNKNFIIIRSTRNIDCFAIIDVGEKKVEVQFFCEDYVEECLDLIENYARTAKKSYINLPLSSQISSKVKQSASSKGFKTYQPVNLIKGDFFAQKVVLMRQFDETKTDLYNKITSPENWDYQHFIYV